MLSSANPRTLFGRAALAAVVGWALACSTSEPAESDARALAPAAKPGTTSASRSGNEPLTVARDLLGRHPALLRPLVDGDAQLRPDGDLLRSPGWEARTHGLPGRVFATVERRADAPLSVGHSPAERYQVRIHREGVQPVEGELNQGRVVYRGAFDAADVVVAASATRVEEFLLLHDDSAPTEYAWQVELPRELGQERHEAGGLVFLDTEQRARLRIPAPVLVDAEGRERSARLDWEGGRLTVGFDPTGLAYPVVLDPAWETAVWEPALPEGEALALLRHAAVFDSGRNVTVLFGGSTPGLETYLPETYEYDGTSWSHPSSTGPGRHSHAMAYAARHSVTVLFGGARAGSGAPPEYTYEQGLDDTWLWNGTTWSPTCTAACTPPPARFDHAMAYDSARQRVVVFGGRPSGNPLATHFEDTWEWDGSSWIKRCGDPSPCGPPARSGHVMTFDAARGEVLLFGGWTFDGSNSNSLQDLWAWDGSSWSEQCTTAPCSDMLPPARSNAGLTYDSHRERAVLYGGYGSGTGRLADTWEWDGSEWTETADGSPTARDEGALVFDAPRRRAVYLGGYTNSGPESEIWEYHSRGEECASDLECQTFHCVDGVCCEQSSCGTCRVCDGGGSDDPDNLATCIPVTNAEDPDSCPPLTHSCDFEGECKKDNGQPATLGTECVSGIVNDGVCCDDECEDQCEACDVAGLLGTCSPVTGAPHAGHTPCDGTGTECAGTCGGSNRTACVYPGETVDCGGHCDITAFVPHVCNGAGECDVGPSNQCFPYACDAARPGCCTACENDDCCAASAQCHLGVNECVIVTEGCYDLFHVERPTGELISCTPYVCEDGRCRNLCDLPRHCAPGYECREANRQCVPTAGSGGASSSGGAGGWVGTGGAQPAGTAGASEPATAGTAGRASTGGSAGHPPAEGTAGTSPRGGHGGDVSRSGAGGSDSIGGTAGAVAGTAGTSGAHSVGATGGEPAATVAGAAGEAGLVGAGGLGPAGGSAGSAGTAGAGASGGAEEVKCECRGAGRGHHSSHGLALLGALLAAAVHRRRRRRHPLAAPARHSRCGAPI